MTDNSEILGTYKGLPVTETSIIVNKLGDGLSAAVGISPIVIEAGDDAYLAVRVRKTKDQYKIVRDDEGTPISVILIQVFDSTGAMFTDEKLAKVGIQKMVDKIKAAEAAAKGQLSLTLVDSDGDKVTKITDLPSTAKERRDAHAEVAAKVDDVFTGGDE